MVINALPLNSLQRPALRPHFTDEETLIQRRWVVQLVIDRTRGLDSALKEGIYKRALRKLNQLKAWACWFSWHGYSYRSLLLRLGIFPGPS